MEQEIIGVISLLREANSVVWAAALRAVALESTIKIVVGLFFSVLFGVASGLFFVAAKENDDCAVVGVIAAFLTFISIYFVISGFYMKLTLEWQAVAAILGR